MPAYRSPAEAEVRGDVVAKLRLHRPKARIIHEINAGSYGNRIDVLAVSPAEIIAVEVKSAKDKLDRLADQISAMRKVAHHVIAAIHEKFLVEQVTNEYAAHYERDGKFYLRRAPDGIHHSVEVWVHPEMRRAMILAPKGWDHLERWRFPSDTINRPLPEGALGLLWRDELHALCSRFGVSVGRRATMGEMIPALRWHCSGAELTRGICDALRSRPCVEADPVSTEVPA